ncbi:hypothetical protein [Methylobacterium durans]|uniref:hypothetical protein n=1 Tax=Methylobacterium durans TaxID=2202825 RepID=UPI0013A557E1|nr:hypothetical protein [Methylobacterium durans]
MRITFSAIGLSIAFIASAHAEPRPSVEQLLKAEAQATLICRGSTDELKIQEGCAWRDRLVGRLAQEGYCWGKKGQIEGDKTWHKCKAGSIYFNDLTPPKL